jgi:hypothetical protein
MAWTMTGIAAGGGNQESEPREQPHREHGVQVWAVSTQTQSGQHGIFL